MDDQFVTVSYLAEPGPQHTMLTLATALSRAEELSIQHVVVATDSGKTARKVLEVFGEDFEIVAVTNPPDLRLPVDKLHSYTERFRAHQQSLHDAGVEAIPVGMTMEAMEKLRVDGVEVSPIDFNRFNRFVRRDVNAMDCIGVAVRVALTCVVWARLEHLVPPDVDVIALAGTGFGGGGADTALVIRTAKYWKNFRVLETLIRPRVSPPSMLNK